LTPGTLIEPNGLQDVASGDGTACVWLTPMLDAAIWDAELAVGEGPGRVYVVEPSGPIEDAADLPGQKPPGRPWMSWRSRQPLRVISEVTEWRLFHGTRADLVPGDLVRPGHTVNYGKRLSWVYLTRTLDAAAWGAELAIGEGRGRIYLVEPTGPVEDDPNLTNKRFRGNPTKSFRSREPLRVTGEVTGWQGHSPEAIQAMKQGLERLKQLGVGAIED
jgi:rifampin ADP-ribosylating transferase